MDGRKHPFLDGAWFVFPLGGEGAGVQQTVLLGGISASSYRTMKRKTDLEMNRDTADRVAYVIRIFQEAGGVFGDPTRWLHGLHHAPVFQGATPLNHMLRGGVSDLIGTYEHLRSIGGGWA